MYTNEHHSYYGNQYGQYQQQGYGQQHYGYGQGNYGPPPRQVEETLARQEFYAERKTFVMAIKENPRGQFLRITEIRGAQSAAIIVPIAGLKDFQQAVAEMLAAANDLPAKDSPPA